MSLKFNDGVTLKTEGALRKEKLKDGWYVLGDGFSVSCRDEEEADETLGELKAGNRCEYCRLLLPPHHSKYCSSSCHEAAMLSGRDK